MIGRHFHANIKLQTAMCKDNNNSKSRGATYVKFDIYIYMHTKLEDISHDIYQKTQQNKTPNRTLTEDYQLIKNPQ